MRFIKLEGPWAAEIKELSALERKLIDEDVNAWDADLLVARLTRLIGMLNMARWGDISLKEAGQWAKEERVGIGAYAGKLAMDRLGHRLRERELYLSRAQVQEGIRRSEIEFNNFDSVYLWDRVDNDKEEGREDYA